MKRKIAFIVIALLLILKFALLFATGGILGLVSYTQWIIWLSLALLLAFLWFFYGYAFRGLYSVKFLAIIIVAVAVVIGVTGFSTKAIKFGNNTTKSKVANAGDNSVICNVGGKTKNFEIISASYSAVNDITSLFASETGKAITEPKSTVGFSFGGNKISNSEQSVDYASANLTIHYINDGANSYQSVFASNAVTKSSITKYDDNDIVGTMTGTLAFVGPNGYDKSQEIVLDCSFNSKLAIVK
ncbi:MAG: hypothetical protein NTW50_04245 [Candidatus Berkelbacteria bacterium]|nr:hypothetical protein [Candidatus Berkelbacteria bacterium]